MSFFDDDDETVAHSATAAPRPRPRAPLHAGGGGAGGGGHIDHQTLMRRRLFAVGVGLVLLLVIVLVINGCLKSEAQQSLKDYNRNVSQLAQESDSQVAKPLFGALAGASGKSALDVEVQIDQLRIAAQSIATRAKSLSVPGDMVGAQRALLLAVDMRAEALSKIAALAPAALGSQDKGAISKIAGDMEIFLASDVLFSQRVVPLIQQALASNGIQGLATTPSHFLPNLGWLEASTALSRIGGSSGASSSSAVASGTHGSALVSTSVATNTLEAEPTINHISGGSSPTFTATVENTGSNNETSVKVDVTVTAGGKQYKAAHVINSTQAGAKVNVEIPVSGIPLGVAAKIEVSVEPVPGETDTENNKGVYLAIFSQ